MAILQTEIVTGEDFSYPEHDADMLVIGGTETRTVAVCRVCGKVEVTPVQVTTSAGSPRLPGSVPTST